MTAQKRIEPLGLEPDEKPHFDMFTRVYMNLHIIKDEQARVSATATIMIATQKAKGGGAKDDAWKDDPITQGQKDYLGKLEDKFGSPVTELMGLACKEYGKDDPNTFTKGEASKLIDQIKKGVGN